MCVRVTERDICEMFLSHFHQDFNCHHQCCYLRNILDERDVGWAPTIISYILEGQFSLSWESLPSLHTHKYTHLQSRATHNPSCCQKIPALPESTVGNFCYCLSLIFPVYLSLFVFCECRNLLRMQKCVCWSRDEGWSVHRHISGKITADKMKGDERCWTGRCCLWCRVLSGSLGGLALGFIALLESGNSRKKYLTPNGMPVQRKETLRHMLKLIYRSEKKGGSGTSCTL